MTGKKMVKLAFVDNYKLIRSVITEYLLKSNFTVTLEASNGDALLNQLSTENCPDICLIEMTLGNVDYETINLIRINWPDIKIVAYSLEPTARKNNHLLVGADAVLPNEASLSYLKHVLLRITQQMSV